MRFIWEFPLIIFLLFSLSFSQSRVKTGDEIFIDTCLNLIKGKNIGIITNQSGIVPWSTQSSTGDSSGNTGRHIVDILANLPHVKVVALFAPEHGIRGEASAGKSISNGIDEKTGIPLYSLYGKIVKPTPEMLKGIDVLIYDIQDVGVRFYTFISTLDLSLEAAAENHIKYIILDRPDMLAADMVDGPVLDNSLRSFVGIQPIPSVYGMTPGELATMINDGHMLKDGVKADLTVIRMENYNRKMWYDQTGLMWNKPSPNLPDVNAVEIYPGNVLFEGTNVSEGRGTEHPFETIGAPFIDSQKLVDLLEAQHIPGVKFQPIDFTPHAFQWASSPKYNSQLCHGVSIIVEDRNIFKPVEMGVTIVWAIHKLFPGDFKFNDSGFDRLCGTKEVRLDLLDGKSPEEIFAKWEPGLKQFNRFREKYLLYR